MKKVVALVTGSNRGIGASCIEEFAKSGVNVVINYCHHKEEAEKFASYIRETYDVEVMTIKCDVSNSEEVEEMVNTIVDTFGGIDILVNNAGISRLTSANNGEWLDIFRNFVIQYKTAMQI